MIHTCASASDRFAAALDQLQAIFIGHMTDFPNMSIVYSPRRGNNMLDLRIRELFLPDVKKCVRRVNGFEPGDIPFYTCLLYTSRCV